MTVSTSIRKQDFAGGQAALTYAFYSVPSHPEYIKVKAKLISTGAETDITYTSGYVVTQTTSGVGGVVTVLTTYSTAYTYVVYRDTTKKQESDYDDYNNFPANTLEKDLDRLMCLSQEADEDVDRAVKHSLTSSASTELPIPVNGKILQWSGTGGAMVNAVYDTASLYAVVTLATIYATTASNQAILAGNYATSSSTSAIAAATSSTLSSNYATSSSTSAIASATSATLAASLVTTKATGAEAIAGVESTHVMTPSLSTLAISASSIPISYLSTDGTLAGTSNTQVVSEWAVYSFVTTSVSDLITIDPYENGTTHDEVVSSASTNTVSATYVKLKEFSPLVRSGNVTITWEQKTYSGALVSAVVYVNDAEVGTVKQTNGSDTMTESNFAVSGGDIISIYGKTPNVTSPCYVEGLKIQTTNPTVIVDVAV